MRRPGESAQDFQAFLTWYCQDAPRDKLTGEAARLASEFSWTSRANRLDEAQAVEASPEQVLRRVASIEAKRLLALVLASPGDLPVLKPREIRDLVEYVRAIPPARKPAHLPANFTIEELNVLEKLVDKLGTEDE